MELVSSQLNLDHVVVMIMKYIFILLLAKALVVAGHLVSIGNTFRVFISIGCVIAPQ